MGDATRASIDAAVWVAVSAIAGAAAARAPDRWFARDRFLLRIRRFERGGRVWESVGVRWWKRRVPDAGAAFGGRTKRRLASRAQLDLLAVETRRAELVHWALLAAAPAFVLWNPPWLAACMALFAFVANAPCIVVQRYNRARIARLCEQRRVRQSVGAW